MADDEGERLDWGNDDDEHQALPYPHDSPSGGFAGVAEDADDAVSLGGDDDDEREFYANHSLEHVSTAGKRDLQRQSVPALSRTPSRTQNSRSPTRDSRPPNSSGRHSMLPPITHALPAKPVLAPPPVEEPTGIRAKPMNNGRHRKVNGSGSAPMASDGNDLPPYWETKYSSSGDVFYYNTKSKETTWIFPSSGRSSPTKARETSGVHGATRRSLEPRDDTWSDRSGRGHHARSAHREHTSHRQSSPPRHPDSSIPARHYRTDNNSASVSDRHASRGGMPYSHDPSYVQARSTSPSATDGRRVARSVSPHWGRRGRRDQSPASTSQNRGGWRETQRGYPQDRSAGGSDSSWTRSQDYAAPSRSLARSPSGLRSRRQEDMEQPFRRKDEFEPRIRRKDDIEPPIRRKDDIEPPIRRKDDIEPPIHRRDNFDQPSRRWGDVEPPLRRRDDFEPNVRRKDDIEPPIRRKDDIEPPIRRRDEVDPHSRRQDDIDARIRRKDDIEPPLRLPASSRHLNDEWSAPRPRSPPPLSYLREPAGSKRPGYPAPPAPAVYGTSALNFREASRYERPSGHPPGRFGDHHSSDIPQRRARESDNMDLEGPKRRRLNDDAEPSRHVSVDLPLSLPAKPPSLPSEPSQVDTQHTRRPLPPQDTQWKKNAMRDSLPPPAPYFRGPPPAGLDSVQAPATKPAVRKSRFDEPEPSRHTDAMDIDDVPSARPARVEIPTRSGTGGMYSDRMTSAAALEAAPRAPRAMARESSYSSIPSSAPSPSPRNTYPSMMELAGPSTVRGGPRFDPPAERRRDSENLGRRASFSGPINNVPMRRMDELPRDFSDRPPLRGPPFNEREQRPRPDGRRPPHTGITGTNNVPFVSRPYGREGVAPPNVRPNDAQPDVRRSYTLDRGGGYDRASMRPSNGPPPERHDDRMDRPRDRGPIDEDVRAPREGGPRQSRFGPPHPNPVEEHVRRPWPSHEKGPSYNARDQTSYPNQIRERRDFKDFGPLSRDDTGLRGQMNGRRGSGPVDDRGPRSSMALPEMSNPPRSITPPPTDSLPFAERPTLKIHPDRVAQVSAGPSQTEPDQVPSSSSRGPPPRSPVDQDMGAGIRHALPRRPDDSLMPPPMERSPRASQNGHRPGGPKRGGSLLERLTLDEPGPGGDEATFGPGPEGEMMISGDDGEGGAANRRRQMRGRGRRRN